MNKRSGTILAVVLALTGGTSGLLGYWKGNQKLGLPGLKIAQEAVLDTDGNVIATNSVFLPERVLDYSSKAEPVTRQELDMLPRDTTYGRRTYQASDGFRATINVVMMGTDRTSIHKPQICLTGQGWRIDRSERTTIPVERPHTYELPVMKLTASSLRELPGGQKIAARAVYVYWFVEERELTADHLDRMMSMGLELIRSGKLQRWAYVSCFSVCPEGQEEAAYQRIRQLIATAVPEFQLATGEPATKGVSSSGAPAAR
ncbi:MAG TPA: exosortase-associated EpsI family protein [Verrucomicrobiae bacterium]|nr:exosortase-associated EpsI family protein [Verrucomicrobiae bacterium]